MGISQRSPSQAPRFVVTSAIGETFINFIENWKLTLKLTWPWWLVQLIFLIFVAVGITLLDESFVDSPRFDVLVSALVLPISLFGAATIAVFWHRKIILNEGVHGFWAMRADRFVWRYLFGLVLAIFGTIAVFGCTFIVMSYLGSKGFSDLYAFYFPFIFSILLLVYFALRLAPSIVSIAVDQKPVGVRRTWVATRGSGLKLVMAYIGVALLCTLLTIPFAFIRGGFNHFADSEFLWIGDSLLAMIRSWIWGFATISLLTVIYKSFFISVASEVPLDSSSMDEPITP